MAIMELLVVGMAGVLLWLGALWLLGMWTGGENEHERAGKWPEDPGRYGLL